jgi:hypothetical protein
MPLPQGERWAFRHKPSQKVGHIIALSSFKDAHAVAATFSDSLNLTGRPVRFPLPHRRTSVDCDLPDQKLGDLLTPSGVRPNVQTTANLVEELPR